MQVPVQPGAYWVSGQRSQMRSLGRMSGCWWATAPWSIQRRPDRRGRSGPSRHGWTLGGAA